MYLLLRSSAFYCYTVYILSVYSEDVVFNIKDDKSHSTTVLNCRYGVPTEIAWKEYCGVWAIRTPTGVTSYIRIDEAGQVDYTTLSPELACRVSRPLDLNKRTEKRQLNFDLLLQGWRMDWNRYFDPTSEFKCYFCNHCKYNGFDTYWSQKQIESFSNRFFNSQEEVTKLCGGDETGKVKGVPSASALVKTYNVMIQGSESVSWSGCNPMFGQRCFGYQFATTLCAGTEFCRKYPPNYQIQQCSSERDSNCARQDGEWGEWSSYFPETCPSDENICHTSPRCRVRSCNAEYRYPPHSKCASGEQIEVDFCYKDCSSLNNIIPFLKIGAAVLVGAILVSIIYIMFAKDSDNSTFKEVEIKKGSMPISNAKLGRRSTSRVGSYADMDDEMRSDIRSDTGSVASVSRISKNKKSRRSSKGTKRASSKQKHSKSKKPS